MPAAGGLWFDVGASVKSAEKQLGGFFSRLKGAAEGVHAVTGAALNLATMISGAFSAGAGALSGVLDAGSQMESFESKLTTLMGSSAAAKGRLEELFAFASTTPFELSQVVEAEVLMQGFGADTEALLGGLIDFSAATGAELSQMASEIAGAWGQGATSLESDFGKVLRAEIELREGVDASTMGLAEFREALLGALDNGKFSGGAARLSQTFEGMVSNLRDEWSKFQKQIADAGAFEYFKGLLAETLDLISQHRTELTFVAQVISEGIVTGFETVGYTVAGILDAVSALGVGLNKLGSGFMGFTEQFAAAEAAILRNLEAAYRFMGLDTAANFLGNLAGYAEGAATEMGALSDSMDAAAQRTEEAGTATRDFESFLLSAKQRAREFGAAGEEGGRQAAKGLAEAKDGAKKASGEAERMGKAWRGALADLEAMARTATVAQLDEIGQIEAARQDALAEAETIWAEGQAAQKALLDQGAITREQYLDDTLALEIAHSKARVAVNADADAKIADTREQDRRDREAAAARAEALVTGAADAEVSAIGQIQQARSAALAQYMEEAEAAALTEQQIAADRAAIISGYEQQIQQARTQAALEQVGQFEGYVSQGIASMVDGLDAGASAAAERAAALQAQLVAGEAYYTKAQQEQLAARSAAAADAAQKQFELSKLAKIADAEMAASLAFVNALAQNPGPIGLAAAGIAFGLAQVQVGAIASQQMPTAHTGAFVNDLAPGEVVIKATQQEAVLSPTARRTLGDETIARAQAGQSPRDQRVLVVDRYRHQTFNRFIKDNLASVSPLSQAVGGTGSGMRD